MYPYDFVEMKPEGPQKWFEIMSLQIEFADKLQRRMIEDGWKDIPYMGETPVSSIKKVIAYVDWLRAKSPGKSDRSNETIDEMYERLKKEVGNE